MHGAAQQRSRRTVGVHPDIEGRHRPHPGIQGGRSVPRGDYGASRVSLPHGEWEIVRRRDPGGHEAGQGRRRNKSRRRDARGNRARWIGGTQKTDGNERRRRVNRRRLELSPLYRRHRLRTLPARRAFIVPPAHDVVRRLLPDEGRHSLAGAHRRPQQPARLHASRRTTGSARPGRQANALPAQRGRTMVPARQHRFQPPKQGAR